MNEVSNEIYKETVQCARKNWKCHYCGKTIFKKQRYRRVIYKKSFGFEYKEFYLECPSKNKKRKTKKEKEMNKRLIFISKRSKKE
jgi:hypothetical protein